MRVHFRPLEATDVPRIAELELELFGLSAWNQAMILEEVNGFGRWYLVAEDEDAAITGHNGIVAIGLDRIVGYAGLWFDGEVTQVMTIGVDPAYQRHQIGRALLQALIERSEQLGAESIFLEVAVDNEPAIYLYRSLGFTPLGIRKRYYQPGNRDAYTMRLQLT